MTLTKADIVEQLTNQIGLNKTESVQLVEGFFEELSGTLASGQEVKLSGFGIFGVRDKTERPGRNPKTGKARVVSARRVVTFSPSPRLKGVVESGGKST